MERKHFVTRSQTVLTKVITISVKKPITEKKYKYRIVKLPATFKEQKVKLWNPKTNVGKIAIAQALGGSGLVRLEDEDDRKNFKLGDILIATFEDKTAKI